MSPQLARQFRTQRLLLRPFARSDIDDVYTYASAPHLGLFLPVPQPYERQHAVEFVSKALSEDWVKSATYALVFDGRVVGGVDLGFFDSGWANLGYSLAPNLWGKGLVVEAVRPVITAGFQAGVARIEISTALPNRRSWRVAEKLGFRYEGTLRSRMLVRDRRYDAVYYGLLPHEWRP